MIKVLFRFSTIASPSAARFSEAEPHEDRRIIRHLVSRAREERSLSVRSCRNRKFRLATGGASFRFDALARVERLPRGSVSENVFVRALAFRFSPRSMLVGANKRNRVSRFFFLLPAQVLAIELIRNMAEVLVFRKFLSYIFFMPSFLKNCSLFKRNIYLNIYCLLRISFFCKFRILYYFFNFYYKIIII